MTKLQSFRQFAHRHAVASGKTFDRQQSLMLLRRHARRVGGFVAEVDKLAQRVPKGRERFVLGIGKSGFRHRPDFNTEAA